MRKLLPVVALCMLALFAFMRTECTPIDVGEVQNLKVTAATDTTVKLTWSVPLEGTPTKYVVYFKEVNGTSYAQLGEVTAAPLEYLHNPAGKTGSYKVVADFSGSPSDGVIVKTEPIHTAATILFELNAAGSSGYGWDKTAGTGSTYSMVQVGNAANVDFYLSDWTASAGTGPFYLISPDLGPTDPGNVVPAGAWKANGLASPVAEQGPLPAHVSGNYFTQQELTQYPQFVGICVIGSSAPEDYFGLVKVSDRNDSDHSVKVEAWYQLVKGLRLISH